MSMNWPTQGYPGYGGFGTPQRTYPNVAQTGMPQGTPSYTGVSAAGSTPRMASADASVPGSTATAPVGLVPNGYTPPGTASTTGVPGANPATPGVSPNLTEWLTNPQQAMIAALSRQGISPFSGDFKVKQALKRADEIMSNILVNAAQGGVGAGDIGNFVTNQITGALNGAPIFRSGSNLTSMLAGLQGMLRSSEQGGLLESNPALAVLGTALGDPQASTGLLQNLMTGGMSTQLANIAGARYAALPGMFNTFEEAPANAGTRGSMIDLLLSGAFQPNATALQQLYAGTQAPPTAPMAMGMGR